VVKDYWGPEKPVGQIIEIQNELGEIVYLSPPSKGGFAKPIQLTMGRFILCTLIAIELTV
jgi:hypothetical protein